MSFSEVLSGESTWHIECADVLRGLGRLPDGSVHCCVTSPPYWGLRDYGVGGQIGLEETVGEYVSRLVGVFGEVFRVLRGDGTLWLNMGDVYNGSGNPAGYGGRRCSGGQQASLDSSNLLGFRGKGIRAAGLKPKDLCGLPWRVAFALQASGWWLRQDIIWHKPNPMPESVTDRCTKAHEYLFLLAKGPRYHCDMGLIREVGKGYGRSACFRGNKYTEGQSFDNSRDWRGKSTGGGSSSYDGSGRNKRSVWTIPTSPFKEAHFATFPPDLIDPCVRAGCPGGGVVLDPFCGAGTTGLVARRQQKRFVGVELNPDYAEMGRRRILGDAPLFNR